MNYNEILKEGENILKKSKIKNPYLDSELILSKVINKKREYILLNFNNCQKKRAISFIVIKIIKAKRKLIPARIKIFWIKSGKGLPLKISIKYKII